MFINLLKLSWLLFSFIVEIIDCIHRLYDLSACNPRNETDNKYVIRKDIKPLLYDLSLQVRQLLFIKQTFYLMYICILTKFPLRWKYISEMITMVLPFHLIHTMNSDIVDIACIKHRLLFKSQSLDRTNLMIAVLSELRVGTFVCGQVIIFISLPESFRRVSNSLVDKTIFWRNYF